MKLLLIIFLVSLVSTPTLSQTRKNMVYSSFIKGQSLFNVNVGLDHAIQISPKKWSSGRFYFVLSPNVMWSGYSFEASENQRYSQSKFDQYEFVLPLHLRYEFAPFRVILGKKPGKFDADVSIFFDVGVSANYILGANLRENFNYPGQGLNFRFSFDGPITSSIENRVTANYLTINFGFRFHRMALFFRGYQSFADTRYKNLSTDWGLPSGAHSFFYDKYPTPSYYYYHYGTYLLCLGYYF